MRAELRRALVDLAGYTEEAAKATSGTEAAYRALAASIDEAGKADDWAKVKKIGEFLEGFDVRLQDTLTDLAQRADEFQAPPTLLDHQIDRVKLKTELDARKNLAEDNFRAAEASGDPAKITEAIHERVYWEDMHKTLVDGGNPLAESSDQIAYLKSVGQHDQADNFLKFQAELEGLLSDPAYHKEVNAHSYTTSSVMRPDLTRTSEPTHTISYVPGAADNIDMWSFLRAEVDESGGTAAHGDVGATATAGTYDAGRDMVNGQVGEADFVRAPEEQPTWVDSPQTNSILKNGEPESVHGGSSTGGVQDYLDLQVKAEKLDYDTSTMGMFVPSPTGGWEPGGFLQTTPLDADGNIIQWADDMPWSVQDQLANTMMQRPLDAGEVASNSAEIVASTKTADFAEAKRIVDPSYRKQQAIRIAAANDAWGVMPLDQRPFTEWSSRPKGIRSWKSPTQRAAKGVRFGDATVAVFDAGKRVSTMLDDAGSGAMIRHVEAPGSGWTPTRQPGFGRTATSASDFPFSVREQVVNALMQGQRVDAENLAALGDEFVAARTQRFSTAASRSEWLKMAMVLRDLQMTHAVHTAQGVAFATNLDGKALGKLLDLFESSSALA